MMFACCLSFQGIRPGMQVYPRDVASQTQKNARECIITLHSHITPHLTTKCKFKRTWFPHPPWIHPTPMSAAKGLPCCDYVPDKLHDPCTINTAIVSVLPVFISLSSWEMQHVPNFAWNSCKPWHKSSQLFQHLSTMSHHCWIPKQKQEKHSNI